MILLYIHVVCLIQRENCFSFVGFKAANTDISAYTSEVVFYSQIVFLLFNVLHGLALSCVLIVINWLAFVEKESEM